MLSDCLLFNIKKLEGRLSKLAEEQFTKLNLHHTYVYILTIINNYGVTKTKYIAYELGLNSSTVTRMVNKLEQDGYVLRGSKNSKVDILLTEKGKNIMPKIDECWHDFHKRYEEILSYNDVKNLNYLVIKTESKCQQ